VKAAKLSVPESSIGALPEPWLLGANEPTAVSDVMTPADAEPTALRTTLPMIPNDTEKVVLI
jgi:hypothetical protein